MKAINSKIYKYSLELFFFAMLLIAYSCSNEINTYDWYGDEYIEHANIVIIHPNPDTGEAYTEEELAELTYDPSKKESYLEGQIIDLTVVTVNMPTEINIIDKEQNVIETITEFTQVDGKYHSKSFVKSLEDLGLLEVDDKLELEFKVTYAEGPPAKASFEVKRIAEGGAVVHYVYINKSNGEVTGLLTDESITSNENNLQYGTVLTFDGVDDKVQVLANSELDFMHTGDFSVGLWVNTTSTNDDPSIIGDKDWGSGANSGFVFAYTGGTWKLNAADGSNRIDINGIGPINDGNWHFILVSFDRDGNAIAYQDGLQVGSEDMSSIGDMDSGLPIHLGQDGTGNYSYGYWYEGMLGRTYIFDYALTAQDVSEFYGSKRPTGAQLRKEDGTIASIGVTSAGGTTVDVDSNMTTYTFDGIDDLVTWDNPTTLDFRYNNDFTIAVWVNTTSTNDDPSIIGDKDWESGYNPGFVFAYTGGTWKLNAADGSNRIDINGLGPIDDGEWHLLAVTFDRDGNAIAYQDGLEVGSTSMSEIGNMDSGFPIRLAQDGTGNYAYGFWFEGMLANSTIFDYALEAEEILALFNN